MEPVDLEHAPRLSVPLNERDHTLGPVDAPLVLVEYGDFECPHCRRAHFMAKALRKAMGKKLRFAFRNFPLTALHPSAQIAAEGAESAARQGKFWEMHDMLFENQDMLGPDAIVVWAQSLNLDMKAFRAAIEDGTALAKIREDRASGIRSGVNGTPTFFVNGYRYNGLPEYGELAAFLQSV
jgi:protein-disulfide isomerase